jgi:hypothetical protein
MGEATPVVLNTKEACPLALRGTLAASNKASRKNDTVPDVTGFPLDVTVAVIVPVLFPLSGITAGFTELVNMVVVEAVLAAVSKSRSQLCSEPVVGTLLTIK